MILFVTQGDHRIDACGSPRRDIASSKRDEHEERAGRAKGNRVVWPDAEEQAGHQARERERGEEAEPQAQSGEAASLKE